MADDFSSTAMAGVGGAAGGASFGPVGMAIGAAVGIGFQLFGASKSAAASQAYNAAQVQQIQTEEQVQTLQNQAANLGFQRQDMENLRKTQQAMAVGLARGVNQGAQFGSGVAGGQAETQSEGNWNKLGISNAKQTTNDIFALNKQINAQRIAQANAGMNVQTGQAYSSLGSGIINDLGAIGRLSSGFGNSGNPTSPGPYQAPVNNV